MDGVICEARARRPGTRASGRPESGLLRRLGTAKVGGHALEPAIADGRTRRSLRSVSHPPLNGDIATGTTICGQPPPQPDGGVAGATVAGTLTLPGKPPQGAKGTVALYTALPPAGMAVTETGFVATGDTSVDYQIIGVPAVAYFILGFVDNDGSGGISSTPGDYAGWYGHNGDGNPPVAANAVVPDSGTARFDFSLVLR